MDRKSGIVIVTLAVSGLSAVSGLCVAADLTPDTHNAQSPQALNPKVAKLLKPVQDSIQKQEWDKALAKLQEAQAVADKKPFDDFQIAELLGYVQLKRQQYPQALAAFEQALASGFLPPEETTRHFKLTTQIALDMKDYPKAVALATRGAATGADPELYAMLGRAQYLAGDYKASAAAMNQAVESAAKNGKPPMEDWLRIAMSANAQVKDRPGLLSSLQQLAAHYPNKQYLQDLFDEWKYTLDDERVALNLYRLMFQLDWLETGKAYLELARLARSAGALGEVITVLQRGKDKKAFAEGDETQQVDLQLATAQSQVAADRKDLAALEQTAAANTGEIDAQLGLASIAYGEYDQGARALQRALAKGGIKNPDEAQLQLGRAFIQLNRAEEARKAFAAVSSTGKLALIARLWSGYAVEPAKIR